MILPFCATRMAPLNWPRSESAVIKAAISALGPAKAKPTIQNIRPTTASHPRTGRDLALDSPRCRISFDIQIECIDTLFECPIEQKSETCSASRTELNPMAMLKEWFRRFWATVRRDTDEKQMHDEIRMHLELAADELQRRGKTREDATRSARLHYGDVPQAMAAMRDQRGLPWLENLVRDVRHAVRMLCRTPGFTGVAILTLALG